MTSPIRITQDEHMALIQHAPRAGGITVATEPVLTSFGPGGVYLLPLDGVWQVWALRILVEMRGGDPDVILGHHVVLHDDVL